MESNTSLRHGHIDQIDKIKILIFFKRMSRVQSVIIEKDIYPTLRSAKTVLKQMGFKSKKVDEKENTWRFRQEEPWKFDYFRTKRVSPGVTFIIGFR